MISRLRERLEPRQYIPDDIRRIVDKDNDRELRVFRNQMFENDMVDEVRHIIADRYVRDGNTLLMKAVKDGSSETVRGLLSFRIPQEVLLLANHDGKDIFMLSVERLEQSETDDTWGIFYQMLGVQKSTVEELNGNEKLTTLLQRFQMSIEDLIPHLHHDVRNNISDDWLAVRGNVPHITPLEDDYVKVTERDHDPWASSLLAQPWEMNNMAAIVTILDEIAATSLAKHRQELFNLAIEKYYERVWVSDKFPWLLHELNVLQQMSHR